MATKAKGKGKAPKAKATAKAKPVAKATAKAPKPKPKPKPKPPSPRKGGADNSPVSKPRNPPSVKAKQRARRKSGPATSAPNAPALAPEGLLEEVIPAGLDPRRLVFISEYLLSGSATVAARVAGFGKTPSTHSTAARRLLSEEAVLREIARRLESIDGACQVTQTYVTNRLRLVAERCLGAVPVLDRLGQHTGIFKFDSMGAVRALELMGKSLHMFADTKRMLFPQISGNKKDVSQMTRDEKLDELRKMRAELWGEES